MRITPLVLAGALAAVALAAPADAAPRKPITKTYEATAPAPDVTNYADSAGVDSYSVCNQQVPNSYHVHTFTAPAPGKLNVKLYGFTGDWDVLLTDSRGTELTFGGNGIPAQVNTPAEPTVGDENITYKIKKAKTKINIIACNWVGGPTATVKYTFTYA